MCNGVLLTYPFLSRVPLIGSTEVTDFTGSEGQCEALYCILSKENPTLFDHAKIIEAALYSDGSKSGFKPLILLPGKTLCCSRKVVIRFVCS